MTQTLEDTGTGNGAIQRRSESPLSKLLESRRGAIQAVLPKHLTADRLIKIALVAVSRTPKLKECTAESILQSVMLAAQLGLDCGGALGSAYLVPFKKNVKDKNTGAWDSWMECTLIIGYRGLIDLARRSGQIVSIEARVVWANDEFSLSYDMTGAHLVHKPALDKEPGAFRLAYAIANLKDGGTQFDLMTKAQVDAIRSRSKSKDDGPWVTDYPEMARKTVVKRLAKYLPISVELAEAVEQDNTADFGDSLGIIDQAGIEDQSARGLNRKMLPGKQLPDTQLSDEGIRERSAQPSNSSPVPEPGAPAHPDEQEPDAGERAGQEADPVKIAHKQAVADFAEFKTSCLDAVKARGKTPMYFAQGWARLLKERGMRSTKEHEIPASDWPAILDDAAQGKGVFA